MNNIIINIKWKVSGLWMGAVWLPLPGENAMVTMQSFVDYTSNEQEHRITFNQLQHLDILCVINANVPAVIEGAPFAVYIVLGTLSSVGC